MTLLGIGAHTFTNKKNLYTEAEHEETHGVALVGLPAEGETAHMVSLVWTVECALGSLKDTEGGARS